MRLQLGIPGAVALSAIAVELTGLTFFRTCNRVFQPFGYLSDDVLPFVFWSIASLFTDPLGSLLYGPIITIALAALCVLFQTLGPRTLAPVPASAAFCSSLAWLIISIRCCYINPPHFRDDELELAILTFFSRPAALFIGIIIGFLIAAIARSR
jgi:hypothetical protein